MISRALNSSNDIFVMDSRITLARDGAEVLQQIRNRLLTYAGECLFNTDLGVPYFEEIFVKPAQLARAESIFKTQILSISEVALLLEFSLNFDKVTRGLSVFFRAQTTFDEIINDEVYINV